jgi:hypothetical protein
MEQRKQTVNPAFLLDEYQKLSTEQTKEILMLKSYIRQLEDEIRKFGTLNE